MTCRVLVADDSAVVRLALVRRFKNAGLEVIEAASVESALALDPTRIDRAVLDFDLGDGFGDQIAAHLRASNPTLEIVFFTSSSEGETGGRLEQYGQVFRKPDQTDAVIQWVLATSAAE